MDGRMDEVSREDPTDLSLTNQPVLVNALLVLMESARTFHLLQLACYASNKQTGGNAAPDRR